MKTFYCAEDIEALASQGVRELTVDADTVLTSVARETAAQLGVQLVTPGQRTAAPGALHPLAQPPARSSPGDASMARPGVDSAR